MIAALFVRTNGPYFNIPTVEPWDEQKDARTYDGPHPVIAHPPCQRWGKFYAGSPSWIAQTGQRYLKGDDGGCFAAALASVRKWGGVLEHPWGSHAWPHFGINVPPREGGWIEAGDGIGWTCCVEQGRYGHYARKPTLLYVVGCELQELDWGISEPKFPPEAVERYGLAKCKRIGEMGFKGGGKDSPIRIDTPEAFKKLLISLVTKNMI